MVTIQDVAKEAGVSPMTVSNVINDHPNVRSTTRAKVLEAIARLGYTVNVAARNLRRGRTGTIGLAVPEVDRPYNGQLAAEIIKAAADQQLRVVLEQTGASRENELDALAMSRNRLYDGLILSTVGMGQADTDLFRTDYPVVLLGERIFEGPVDHVAMPNVDGARAATAHLVENGCRRVAILYGPPSDEIDMSSLRFAGYQQALTEAGLDVHPELVVHLDEFTMRSGARAVRSLVRGGAHFDGIFCVTDTVAIGVLRGLADLDIAVPEQVKVIGFDGIDEGSYTVPSLSTVDPDHRAMARVAVDRLVARIAGQTPEGGVKEHVSPFTVVARESTVGRTPGH
ncbi:LacI family DNA-binding transcriptional regulator [Streptomyces galilaeus]